MVEPVYHKEKIMGIGNRLREIRKSVNKKSQMSLRDMLVLALMLKRVNLLGIFFFKYVYVTYLKIVVKVVDVGAMSSAGIAYDSGGVL